MKIRFFRYSGSKFDYTSKINNIINNSKSKIYIEPFVGSGAVLFNTSKNFDRYIINDKDKNIIQIYKTFKHINYSDYLIELNFVEKEFGDIKNCKECYYNFRNWFNENYWKSETIKEGIYLHFLANTCINSFLRFGPNGMNQSFGHRFYKLNNIQFNMIREKLQKTEIYNTDYQEFFNVKNSLMFLDPPYILRKSSYDKFTSDNFNVFMNLINDSDNEIVYTDILFEKNKHLNKVKLRNMVNSSPYKGSKNDFEEFLFYKNINYDNNTLNEWLL